MKYGAVSRILPADWAPVRARYPGKGAHSSNNVYYFRGCGAAAVWARSVIFHHALFATFWAAKKGELVSSLNKRMYMYVLYHREATIRKRGSSHGSARAESQGSSPMSVRGELTLCEVEERLAGDACGARSSPDGVEPSLRRAPVYIDPVFQRCLKCFWGDSTRRRSRWWKKQVVGGKPLRHQVRHQVLWKKYYSGVLINIYIETYNIHMIRNIWYSGV